MNNNDSDLDYAIALSLQESENQNPSITNQKSSSSSSNDRNCSNNNNNNNIKIGSLLSSFFNLNSSLPQCSVCKKSWMSGICIGDDCYHSSCFKCTGCGQIIEESYIMNDNQPYHSWCARELFHPKCSICNSSVNGVYRQHSFFKDEIYCSNHNLNSWPSCFSCQRKEPLSSSSKEPFNKLPDGRHICYHCVQTIILDSHEAQPLYLEVLRFMNEQLGLLVTPEMREVSVLAVDTVCLNEQRGNGVIANHRDDTRVIDFNHGTVRGLTIHSTSTIRHMTPGSIAWDSLFSGYRLRQGQVFRTDEIREVSAVLILYGLPRDLTASILAHEAMHVWMKLTHSYPLQLPSQVEEGLCQLVAAKYLQYISIVNSITPVSPNSSSSSSSSSAGVISHISATRTSTDNEILKSRELLRTYFLHGIKEAEDDVYGEGYRKADRCCNEIGLELLLDHIKNYKNFPSI